MPIFREEPYGAFNFQVEFLDVGIEGDTVRGGFSEVSGLNTEVATVEYRNGNDRALSPRRLPGLVTYTDVTLKRGVIGDLTLYQWIQQSVQGSAQRADGRIQLLDESRQVVMSWRICKAWPIRFKGPDLNGAASAIAIEELVLAHDGLEIET